MTDSKRQSGYKPLRGRSLQQAAESAIYTNPVDGHNCMKHKPKYGQDKFTCPCGKYYELAGCGPGDYWEEKTPGTTEYVPYPVAKPDIDSWLEVGKLVLKNFQIHERAQYVEFIFLCLGIVYFIEAIIKNTIEILR